VVEASVSRTTAQRRNATGSDPTGRLYRLRGQGSSGPASGRLNLFSRRGRQLGSVIVGWRGLQNPLHATACVPFSRCAAGIQVETSALTAQNGEHPARPLTRHTAPAQMLSRDLFEFFAKWRSHGEILRQHPDTLKRNRLRHRRRPDQEEQDFLLHRLPGSGSADATDSTCFLFPTAAMLGGGDFTAFAVRPLANAAARQLIFARFRPTKDRREFMNPSAVAMAKDLPTPINDCGKVNYAHVRLHS